MEKTIFEQMGGTYAQAGDYNLPSLILSNEESKPIGIWGQRHARYLKQNRKVLYMNLLTSGKRNACLANIDKQAQERFERLIPQTIKNMLQSNPYCTPQVKSSRYRSIKSVVATLFNIYFSS